MLRSALPPSQAQPDWAVPWLTHLRACGRRVVEGAGPLPCEARALCASLNAQPGLPVRFVPQAELPAGEAYEAFIRRTGQVPTRGNLHDFFNGLVWQRFPLAKTRLNRIQAAQIAEQGVGARRGPVRDAVTLFDENGAVLLAPPGLWEALLARDWQALFVARRALWAEARLVLFGHALMEQLVSPRKNITAHVLIEQFAIDSDVSLDANLALALSPERLATKPFTPLPVLGVPGWCAANATPDYYSDLSVFRPPRIWAKA